MKWTEIIREDARLDRAHQLGFDTGKTWYHATHYAFDRFVPSRWRGAIYFASTPEGAIRGASAGAAEHPALSGPTVGDAARTGLQIIPVYIKGKTWGRDPLPLDWFPETMTTAEYYRRCDFQYQRKILRIPGTSDESQRWLAMIRTDLMPLIYDEDLPPVADDETLRMSDAEFEQWKAERYRGFAPDDVPMRRDKLPIASPFWSYADVEGIDKSTVAAMLALGFQNWLVSDEGGVSIAVSNPANIRVKHAWFDPARAASHAMSEDARRPVTGIPAKPASPATRRPNSPRAASRTA